MTEERESLLPAEGCHCDGNPSGGACSYPDCQLPIPKCRTCDGNGWYVGHEDECCRTGDCACSGVQIQCEVCFGTGEALS